MSINLRNSLIITVLLLAFAAEAYCVTYFRFNHEGGFLNTTWLFIASGLLLTALPFWLRKPQAPLNGSLLSSRVTLTLLIVTMACLSAFLGVNAAKVFRGNPADYHGADMIPMIKACCHRFVRGEKIYAPVYEIWNGEKPAYLPMMWLPWIPCEYLTSDLRWTSVIFFLGGAALIMSLVPYKRRGNVFAIMFMLGVFWYYAWYFSIKDDFYLSHIQECVVIGYYLLLGYALSRNNPWLIGIAIGCCLLSRYMLIFWVPVYIIYTFFFTSRRNALITFGVVTGMELFIFILPYWIWQPKYFSDLLEVYHRSMYFADWEHSLGLGVLFPKEHIELLVRAEFIAAISAPVIAFLLAVLLRNWLKKADKRLFGICSLKLTMVGFYVFLETPFYYLFFVPAVFSAAICALALRIISLPKEKSEEGSEVEFAA